MKLFCLELTVLAFINNDICDSKAPKAHYRKFPNYSDTQKSLRLRGSTIRVTSSNDADRMANSIDPDQTAPLGAVWSGSTLFARHTCPKT